MFCGTPCHGVTRPDEKRTWTPKHGQLKLKLQDINQNPFRQSLLDTAAAADGSGGSGDISEDMSWGFDQTFFGEEGDGDGDDDPDDYDDI